MIVSELSKRYGETVVLESVSFVVNQGEKIGIVGANGVGKSTVIRIIAGEIEPDGGTLTFAPATTVGYLAQEMQEQAGRTIAANIDEARGGLVRLEAELRRLEAELAGAGDHTERLTEYAHLLDLFERRGGYVSFQVDQILAGLGLAAIDPARPVASLSGGEKSRLGLATLLLRSPDLLLLDEPTNHLDGQALGWLEDYLAVWQGALLVVSHDRQFLDRTVSQIVEIDEHTRQSRSYAGNYTAYAAAREQERVRWREAYEAQQEEIRELKRTIRTRGREVAHGRAPRDNDGFYYAFKGGRVDTAVARNVHAAEEKLRRIEADPVPKPPRPLRINPEFNPALFGSRTPLAFADLEVRYGEHRVLAGVSGSVGSNARIVVVGPNGSGKSTLLKALAGALTPNAGRVSRAPGVVVGYLDQEQETLSVGLTVYEAYAEGLQGDFETLKYELLATGLFMWPEFARRTEVLSAGQKRKLQIARLLAVRANVLLLDEPTNHISLDVLEQFERALLDFPGPIVAISHDRRFIARFAAELWEIVDGTLRRPTNPARP